MAAEKIGDKVVAPAEEEAHNKEDDALRKQKDNHAAEYIRIVLCPLLLMTSVWASAYDVPPLCRWIKIWRKRRC